MRPINAALLIVILLAIIIAGRWLMRRARILSVAIGNWGAQLDPECDDPTKSPAACEAMLSGPLDPPPPAQSRPTTGPPPFDAPTSSYAVRLSARFIAYLSTKDTALITMTNMMPPALSFSKSSLDTALAITWASMDGYSAVVAIRGTKTVYDFRLDMKFHEIRPSMRQTALKRPATSHLGDQKVVQVHSGMYSEYVDVRDSLFAALPTALTTRGTGSIFIAGHSMGAAVSFYYALELAAAYPNFAITVVGIAPPRAGDAAFSADISAAAFCTTIVNLADFVPSMPWSYMPDQTAPYAPDEYAHVGPVFAFNNRKMDITACHGLLAYFEGVSNTTPPAYLPETLAVSR